LVIDESWQVNRHSTGPVSGLDDLAGVWLMAEESEINVSLTASVAQARRTYL